MAVAAAFGATTLMRPAGARGRLAGTALLAVLLPLEHQSTPLRDWAVPARNAVPQVYSWLAARGEPSPIVEFTPAPRSGWRDEAGWVHLSTLHWQPIVNGYASYRPLTHALIIDQLLYNFPTRGSIALLQRLGVRYLVHHPGRGGYSESIAAARRFEKNVGRFSRELELVASFDDAGVYDGPLGRLGGERVYRVHNTGLGLRLPVLDRGRLLDPKGWTCESLPPAAGCQRAFDGLPSTWFSTERRQRGGDFVTLRFPEPRRVQGVKLISGYRAAEYPRRPEVWGLSAGRRILLGRRFRSAAFLGEFLERSPRAGITFAFEPRTLEGIRVALRPAPSTLAAWSLVEIEIYGVPETEGEGES